MWNEVDTGPQGLLKLMYSNMKDFIYKYEDYEMRMYRYMYIMKQCVYELLLRRELRLGMS